MIKVNRYKGMIYLGEMNLVMVLSEILVWAVIAFLAYRIYKKQTERPKRWKLVFILFIGLFSFSINWNFDSRLIRMPVLPLGVWILLLIFRRKKERWPLYRPYAWLGFLANFILLLSHLLSIPLYQSIYPQTKLSIYIADLNNPRLILLHPSAKKGTIDQDRLQKQLSSIKQGEFYNDEWYSETYMGNDSNQIKERFPYQLIGSTPKFGSGITEVIYVEKDGKGILISTPDKQFYFHSNESMLKGSE